MATARLLLSTGLSIHRKHHVTSGSRSSPPKLR